MLRRDAHLPAGILLALMLSAGSLVALRATAEDFAFDPSVLATQDSICPDPGGALRIRGRKLFDGARGGGRTSIVCRTITFEPDGYIETTGPLSLSATEWFGGPIDIRRAPVRTRAPGSAADRPPAAAGATGRDGEAGEDGSRCNQVFIGRRSRFGKPGLAGADGIAGVAGRGGASGRAGAKGPDITLVAADFAPDTSISIQARGDDGEAGRGGGAGQEGGAGGDGGDGGRGGAGGFCFRPSDGGRGGPGGSGGAGGPGGRGGDGGDGGPGGTVILVIGKAATRSWTDLIIDNRGGRPGPGGAGGPGGHGGPAGAGGRGGPGGVGSFLGADDRGALSVPDGRAGPPGEAGEAGSDGATGRPGAAGENGMLGRAVWRLAP